MRSNNDWLDYLEHTQKKGATWKEHKYIKKINGIYYYGKDALGKLAKANDSDGVTKKIKETIKDYKPEVVRVSGNGKTGTTITTAKKAQEMRDKLRSANEDTFISGFHGTNAYFDKKAIGADWTNVETGKKSKDPELDKLYENLYRSDKKKQKILEGDANKKFNEVYDQTIQGKVEKVTKSILGKTDIDEKISGAAKSAVSSVKNSIKDAQLSSKAKQNVKLKEKTEAKLEKEQQEKEKKAKQQKIKDINAEIKEIRKQIDKQENLTKFKGGVTVRWKSQSDAIKQLESQLAEKQAEVKKLQSELKHSEMRGRRMNVKRPSSSMWAPTQESCDYLDFLAHSGKKGMSWKDHKYLTKINGVYKYATNSTSSPTAGIKAKVNSLTDKAIDNTYDAYQKGKTAVGSAAKATKKAVLSPIEQQLAAEEEDRRIREEAKAGMKKAATDKLNSAKEAASNAYKNASSAAKKTGEDLKSGASDAYNTGKSAVGSAAGKVGSAAGKAVKAVKDATQRSVDEQLNADKLNAEAKAAIKKELQEGTQKLVDEASEMTTKEKNRLADKLEKLVQKLRQ